MARTASAQPQMCVGLERVQASIKHGQAAQWVVSVYTTGADATNVSVGVSAAPAGQHASFDFGCGAQNGSTACGLGQVNAAARPRQVQAQISVPATSSATSVRLTATVSADHLPVKPQASVTVTVAAGAGAPIPPVNFLTDAVFRNASYLPAIGPNLSKTGTALSPGGNASGLFPELVPGAQSQSPNGTASRTRNTVALASAGLPEVNAQIAGVAALALALLLAAVPSLRRRLLVAVPSLREHLLAGIPSLRGGSVAVPRLLARRHSAARTQNQPPLDDSQPSADE
ncbi:MAG TPA: hypothetical protein VF060_30980 [Trebonia sp.]